MDILVTLPDDADPAAVDSLEASITAVGGTWTPAPEGEEMAEGEMGPEAALAAGPGAGMTPGAAMAGVGARALRPR